MSTQPDTRSSDQPLGGTSGDWRYRLFRYHVPLALASALVLVLFTTLPPFDVSAYPHGDIFSGTFPQPRSEGGPMDHRGGGAGPMSHGGDQAGPVDHAESRAGPIDHGLAQVGATGQGGGEAELMGHPGGQTGLMGHSGSRAGAMAHSGSQTEGVSQGERMGGRGFNRQFTLATGYLALGLLAVTLLIGPANLLLRRRNPVSTYLRRDVGTWTATFSVVHVVYGLTVHGSGQISGFVNYFVTRDGGLLTNSFGLANWTGLAALVIVLGLLAISNDAALRRLKARPWKWLQRFNYALFALVILHAFFYGALLRVTSPFTLLLALSAIVVFVGQAMGVSLWRRRFSRPTVTLA